MSNLQLDSLDVNEWCDLIGYSNLLDDVPADLYLNSQLLVHSSGAATDILGSRTSSKVSEFLGRECTKKRVRKDPCTGGGSKACREKLRRDTLNSRFAEFSAILEPGRPVKTDKLAILGDTIRVLDQLKAETQEYNEMNKKLLEETRILKAEKNELREEKLVLKANNERIEQKLKSITVPPTGFIPAYPPVFQAGADKMPMFPGYSFIPMWQYMPSSACDTSQDHALRSPAA